MVDSHTSSPTKSVLIRMLDYAFLLMLFVDCTFRCALKNMSKIHNVLKVFAQKMLESRIIFHGLNEFSTLHWSLTSSLGRNGVGELGMSLNRMLTF